MGTSVFYYLEKRESNSWKHVALPEWNKGSRDDDRLLWDILGHGDHAILPLRPLPRDLSSDTKNVIEQSGNRSPYESWLSLEDLLLYDWDQPWPVESYLLEKDYRVWDQVSKPAQEWIQAGLEAELKSLASAKHKSIHANQLADLEKIKQSNNFDPYAVRLVLAKWHEPLKNRLPYFYGHLIPHMESLAGPADIRLIIIYEW